MSIYVYWGEDDFAMHKAIVQLRDRLIDSQWLSFNYTSVVAEPNAITRALNEVMTPPFGTGSRLVWLVDTNICQQCSEDVLIELQRTLPIIPENSVLLLSCRQKPDRRLKSTQLFQKYAEFREFSLIPPWKTAELLQRVQQAAAQVQVKLTPATAHLLAEYVGNNTRQLYNELEKLRTFAADSNQPLDVDVIRELVSNNTQSSLQLAAAIKDGNSAKALTLVTELINCNEPALKIVATLIAQFRTWLWVKLLGETEKLDVNEIARVAEVSNPKRVYFLQQEVKQIRLHQLEVTLPLLLELEVSLKQGSEEMSTLQTKIIELCQVFG